MIAHVATHVATPRRNAVRRVAILSPLYPLVRCDACGGVARTCRKAAAGQERNSASAPSHVEVSSYPIDRSTA